MHYKELLESSEKAYLETNRYKHFKNIITSERYFSNYISYKIMPTVSEFLQDMIYLADEQKDYQSDFAFVFFEENAELSSELQRTLSQQGFESEKHIIFTNSLNHLKLFEKEFDDITFTKLNENYLEKYLKFKYEQSIVYGETYAKQMYNDNRANLLNNNAKVYLAIKDNQIIGDVTAWDYGEYVEIDDFYVQESYRGQGIGTRLQFDASRGFKKVILISEEENRKMYEHQGYEEVAYYWTALRSPRK